MKEGMTMTDQRVQQVSLDELHDSPYQPRQEYNEDHLRELADSIRENGVLSPLSIRPRPAGGFEIIGGHRRSRAARQAGLAEVPCIIQQVTDADARRLALLDNLQREDLMPWEEGEAFAALISEEGLSQAEVAKAAGKSPAYVGGRIRLAEGAGQALRQAFLRGQVGLSAMEAVVAKLPKHEVTAKECARCRVIVAGDVQTCPACGADCRFVLAITADAQAVAVRKLIGKPTHQAPEIVQAVAERYGLAGRPVQVSLGFNDLQIREEVLATKTDLERRLAQIGNLRDWALQHQQEFGEYPPTARVAAQAQLRAAQAALRQVAEMLSEPALALSAM
jgi:ParB/RepB/Spo0J family partition protein